MRRKLFLELLPHGKYAAKGYYYKPSSRTLVFEVSLDQKSCVNYDSLMEEPAVVFSMTGASRRGRAGDQGIEEIFKKYRDRVPSDKLQDFDRLIDIWRKYHLNDMCPGTKRQIDAIEQLSEHCTYEKTCEYLTSIRLLVDDGYKYGTRWLCMPIPKGDVGFLNKICNEWGENND